MKKLLFVIVCLFLSLSLVAQKQYSGYVEYCPQEQLEKWFQKDSLNDFYVLNKEYSRAILVQAGDPYKIPFSIVAGKDYKIKIYLTDFQNLDFMKYVITNEKDSSLFYEEVSSSIEIKALKSYDLFFQVIIPGNNQNKEIVPGIIKKVSNTGCLIFLFEEGNSLQTGF